MPCKRYHQASGGLCVSLLELWSVWWGWQKITSVLPADSPERRKHYFQFIVTRYERPWRLKMDSWFWERCIYLQLLQQKGEKEGLSSGKDWDQSAKNSHLQSFQWGWLCVAAVEGLEIKYNEHNMGPLITVLTPRWSIDLNQDLFTLTNELGFLPLENEVAPWQRSMVDHFLILCGSCVSVLKCLLQCWKWQRP